jgi:glyoxylase-like metal-dependent hydrolase (beta-lactamase superfamily II)
MVETCRIVALGGLGEVGKNMTVYECGEHIVVVDAGLAFPRDEHLGVDLVLPDFSYLRDRASAIRAVILTHGHEDHVGSLPYLMREIWRGTTEGGAGIAALPYATGIKNLTLTGGQILPGLGIEGELVAGWSAAKLALAISGKKKDYLRDEVVGAS